MDECHGNIFQSGHLDYAGGNTIWHHGGLWVVCVWWSAWQDRILFVDDADDRAGHIDCDMAHFMHLARWAL